MKEKGLGPPRITHFSWGRLEIEGKDKPFKDAKLYPGGAREFGLERDGNQTYSGNQPSDVIELLEHGVEEVILSVGVYKQLRVCSKTMNLLKERGIPTHVLDTPKL
ncbi:MAG: hypothetical protein QXX77_10550 [Candidatus Methanosuratincola sp.]|jgi:hypothetical protein